MPNCSISDLLYVLTQLHDFLWYVTWSMWILETKFWISCVELSYHHFQCLFYTLFQLFFCLFLPLSLHFHMWTSSFCWTSWTILFLCGDLWSFLCPCVLLHTSLKWFTFPHPHVFAIHWELLLWVPLLLRKNIIKIKCALSQLLEWLWLYDKTVSTKRLRLYEFRCYGKYKKVEFIN